MDRDGMVRGLDYEKIGLRVGLEIHQQLSTGRKLFCGCAQRETERYAKKFSRRLRVSKSEMGEYDPAAVFERGKSRVMIYHADPASSCLVEEDEEPPHDLDSVAKETALLIGLALESEIFREIFPMRKTVIDGSNTSGFQRTMLISQGGRLRAGGTDVGVQSICLEEDAARLIGDKDGTRQYGLERLGIPLVEIALEPVRAGPKEMRGIALALGRLLRTTGRVSRGLGSIRQDVNVSVDGGGIVEVKGVQQLDQLEKVVEYEARRQDGLMRIAERLRGLAGGAVEDVLDITDDMGSCKSKIIQKSIRDGCRIHAMRAAGFAGMFGYCPHEGVRLGREIAQLVRFYGIGGVFHSDELPDYGMDGADVAMIKGAVGAAERDAFLVVAIPPEKYGVVIGQIIGRIEQARSGVPAETRLATQTGETVFLRPRPGASRMYPETDIPPVMVSDGELDRIRRDVPRPWDQMVSDLKENYGLNAQLAEQVLDSERLDLFERVCSAGGMQPNFVASALCSTVTSLQRRGLDPKLLKDGMIEETFSMLADGKIAKESVGIIFEGIMRGDADTVDKAVRGLSIGDVSDEEISGVLDRIIRDSADIVRSQGERAVRPLMGAAMKELRGRASGEKINRMLAEKILDVVKRKKTV